MLRIAMALILVASLAACDTAMSALPPVQEGELSTLSHGSGTIVTEDNIFPDNEDGDWHDLSHDASPPDFRWDADIAFVTTHGSPTGADLGDGALYMYTNDDRAFAGVLKEVDVLLRHVGELSYWTYQPSGNQAIAAPSYKLFVTFYDPNEPDGLGWTFLVYEPYWQDGSDDPAPVVGETWQQWTRMKTGNWWSSRNSSQGLVSGLGEPPYGGPPFYTLPQVLGFHPDATVKSIQVGIGKDTPGYHVLTDGLTFNGETFNFEPYPYVEHPSPDSREDCMNGGWETFGYKNQGQCVASVVANENSGH